MRLERHVGGLGRARTVSYLLRRGWREEADRWVGPAVDSEPCSLSRALHHQLTFDLTAALGWKVVGYSPRGYVQLVDPVSGTTCTLPAALRRQARREKRAVKDLTYTLFLSKLDAEPGGEAP